MDVKHHVYLLKGGYIGSWSAGKEVTQIVVWGKGGYIVVWGKGGSGQESRNPMTKTRRLKTSSNYLPFPPTDPYPLPAILPVPNRPYGFCGR